MATPMRKYTRETSENAALDRCVGAHLQGTARLETVEEDGEGAHEFWTVPSEDRLRTYTVVSHQQTHVVEFCSCPARVPCKHMGAVVYALRQRAKAQQQPEETYSDGGAFR